MSKPDAGAAIVGKDAFFQHDIPLRQILSPPASQPRERLLTLLLRTSHPVRSGRWLNSQRLVSCRGCQPPQSTAAPTCCANLLPSRRRSCQNSIRKPFLVTRPAPACRHLRCLRVLRGQLIPSAVERSWNAKQSRFRRRDVPYCAWPCWAGVSIDKPRCEYQIDPLGHWLSQTAAQLGSAIARAREIQTAYQVLVRPRRTSWPRIKATCGIADAWMAIKPFTSPTPASCCLANAVLLEGSRMG